MSLARLKERAESFAKVRRFFEKRGVLEVDAPSLIPYAPLDSHIEVMEVEYAEGKTGYLHTSPEYAMKKMLSQGAPDIYYLGHVFRKGEIGPRHSPEFTMIEWYRKGFSLDQLIEETHLLLTEFLGDLPLKKLSYRDAFLKYVGLDPFEISLEALQKRAIAHAVCTDWDRDSCLDLLLSHEIEPELGKEKLTVLLDYPPSQAALAQTIEKQEREVAKRFEIYFQGIELCNGYHELGCPQELKKRFLQENERRLLANKPARMLDTDLLKAMGENFPDCSGVSVGFDRVFDLFTRLKKVTQ